MYWWQALLVQVISSGNHRQFQRSRQRMRTPIRRWQLRGLVLHHRRHPATHSRRLVNRTASWGEPPVNGICRWCYERTANIKITLAPLLPERLSRVASGQHPDEIQHTLCEICGDPSDEMDHRLAIEVARALGPAAILRAFTPEQPALALPWLPQAQDQAGQVASRSSCRPARWTGTVLGRHASRHHHRWAAVVSATVQPGACAAAQDFSRRAANSRRSVRQASGQENPAQQGERQSAASQHEVLRPAYRVGQSLSDRRGIYPRSRRWKRFARRSGTTNCP